jgi:oligogalacturonide lyase
MSERYKVLSRITLVAFFSMLFIAARAQAPNSDSPSASATPPPITWIDKSTGHRVIRLTDQPGSRSLYFNVPAFAQDGKQMVYVVERKIYLVDLETRESRLLVSGPMRELAVARNGSVVYFTKVGDNGLYAADIASGELRQIAILPARAQIGSVNSDGTLIAGTLIEGSGPDFNEIPIPKGVRPTKAEAMTLRAESKLPMALFTLDIATGKIKTVLHSTDWLSHVQFSPTDPSLLLYCHEGLWENVDRIWTIRTDGSKNQLIHEKSQKMEIAGHEFWDVDGKTIWYDLQVPKGKTFFLASYNTENGERHHYQMDPNQWSIHFNGTSIPGLFAGDGGDELQVARASDGKWINLYHTITTGSNRTDQNGAYKDGVLEFKHLVNLSANDYRIEPNVRFTPDRKYLIFTSSMLGSVYVFAVEVEHASRLAESSPSWRRFESTVAKIAMADVSATIQVVDHSNQPLANALVSIKSLDTGHQVGIFKTSADGSFQLPTLDQGLHRFTIICPDGKCSNTIHEIHASQLTGNGILQADADSAVAPSFVSGGGDTTITILDANHRALGGVQFLVRTTDATEEQWYTTDKNGSANVTLPADPSVFFLLLKRVPFTYRLASTCNSSSEASAASTVCIQVGTTTVITLPQS